MTPEAEARFARLLRWYPRRWRRANGDVLLSSLLDAAEHEGRTAPTRRERRAAAVHGTAARIDGRFALASALIAVALAVAAGTVLVWGIQPLASRGLSGVLPAVVSGAVPAFTAFGVVALVRQSGRLADGRTLVLLALAVVASALNALTMASWSAAFDAADEQVPVEGIAAAWLPLAGAALGAGAAFVGTLADALLARTTLSRLARGVLAGFSGIVAAPIIGLGLISPYVGGLGALAVTVLAARLRASDAPPPAPALPKAPRPLTRAARGTVRLLAGVAVAGGLVGIVYAFTGAQWSPGAVDGTAAMGQGITLLLFSGIPFLSALGLLGAARSRVDAVHVWGPLALVALSFVSVALGYLRAPSWGGMAPWLQAAAFLVGGAIAWWIIPRARARLRPVGAVLVGGAAGLVYASFLGMLVTPMLAFVVPIAAVVVVAAGLRRRADVAEGDGGLSPGGLSREGVA